MTFFLLALCIGIPIGLLGSTELSNEKPNVNRACDCGIGKAEKLSFASRIINGVTAEPNTFPWVVYLTDRGGFSCGGAIINNLYVLTAGHCIDNRDMNKIKVVVGAHTLYKDGLVLRIKNTTVHPNYERSKGVTFNDLALIRLEKPLEFSDNIQPICLPRDTLRYGYKQYTNKYGVIAGWGTTENGKYPTKLLHSRVRILSDDKCTNIKDIQRFFKIEENFCAYMYESDACKGDSGSSVFYETEPYNFEMIGIVSWGIGCGKHGVPGVYVRISSYVDWIYKYTRDATYCHNPALQ